MSLPSAVASRGKRVLSRTYLEHCSASFEASGAHAGDCSDCHSSHGEGDIAYPHALIGPDDNTLCDGCHRQPWAGGSYPQSEHAGRLAVRYQFD